MSDELERSHEVANFLPGPVAVAKSVLEAFQRTPISHRSDEFGRLLRHVRGRLGDLTHAADVAVLQGSGTLANDVVGAQLSLGREPGLVLSNGEFGERLVDHADGFGLDYVAHRIAWGAAFDLAEVERVVANRRDIRWLWAVHCETSTGVLNDLDGLKSLARRRGLKLCMDCVSSVGAVDTNLSGVHLAAGVSGKALAALPGLALVFIGGEFVPVAGKLPRYLDLTQYRRGVPFTLCSNLLVALDAALVDQTAERRETIARGTRHLREQLAAAEVATVADASVAAPHVTTIKLPQDLDSATVAKELATQGLLVAFASEYLRARNWLQVCLMAEFTFSSLDRLASALARKQHTPAL